MIIRKVETQLNQEQEAHLSEVLEKTKQDCQHEIQKEDAQQIYQDYQSMIKYYQKIYQNKIKISEESISQIIMKQQEIEYLAVILHKQQDFSYEWQLLIRFISSQHSQSIIDSELRDEINYLEAKTYILESNYQKACQIYKNQIHISSKLVPSKWIPFIVETFQKQNNHKYLSYFCLEQQKLINKICSEIDYYLLSNILNKKADLDQVNLFIKNYQIEQIIDSIISSFNNYQFTNDLYEKHLQKYQLCKTQLNNFYENSAQDFLYKLLQSYGIILKETSYPSIKYIKYSKQLRQISKTQQINNLNLEIAKTYQDLNEIQNSIKYYEKYLLSVPNNLGIMFDLQFLYQSNEDFSNQKRIHDFFKKILINNPQQIQYFGILLQNNNISFSQLKSLILEYLQMNMNHFQNLFKFIEYINHTVFTQNSFFNNRTLINSFLYFLIEKVKAICQKIVFYKIIIPQLTFQPIYSLNDLYFE